MKSVSDELLTWKSIALVLIFYGVGYMERIELLSVAAAYELEINKWDYLLNFMTHSRLTIFIVLPFWIFYSSYSSLQAFDNLLLLRLKNYRRWMIFMVSKSLPALVVLIALWTTVGLILTLDLPFSWDWSPYGVNNITYNEIIYVYRATGYTPAQILLIQLVLLTFSLLSLSILTSFVCAIKPTILGMGIYSFVLFIYIVVSFKFFPKGNWFTIYNYTSFYPAFETFTSIWVGVTVLAAFSIFLIFVIDVLKSGRYKRIPSIFAARKKESVYGLLLLFGLATPVLNYGLEPHTVWDLLFQRFIGYSENPMILFVLFYTIVFIGFAYLVMVELTEFFSGPYYYDIIRYSSFNMWAKNFMARMMVSIIKFLLLLFVITIAVGLSGGLSLQLLITIKESTPLWQVIYHFFVNGFLQILNYVFITLIVMLLTKEIKNQVLTLAAFVFLGWLSRDLSSIVPVGLNSFGYITGKPDTILYLSLILFVFSILEASVIMYLIRNKKTL
ncbi:hypothetical protein SAMN05444162_2956 [Paenibacillaceae bacterium GAS479]|nr:hypothetical protein SAMN05444162_2956 [Paenibacillaceae bacterium GAS479]